MSPNQAFVRTLRTLLTRRLSLGLTLVVLGLLAIAGGSEAAQAQGLPLITASPAAQGTRYSMSLELLALMTVLTLLPSMLLMMTPFVRIVVVLSLLRQALGTGQTPPNQVLVGLSLFLSVFIMAPTLGEVYQKGILPYTDKGVSFEKALPAAQAPLRAFMLRQVRADDIAMFSKIAREPAPASPEATPFTILVPAFITSELKSAFTIGFLLYIPFVVIDLVVASALMSLGMMMLSPMMISLPFKLMLFVLVDGWGLTMSSLAASFTMP
jgi:flagellar biosynthetic protein FliP